MLGNTYHLGNRPGVATLEAVGGLHNFMNWKRALLTGTVILFYLGRGFMVDNILFIIDYLNKY